MIIGIIKDGMVYSDALFPDLIDTMIHELRSKSYNYSPSGIETMSDLLKMRFEDNKDIINIIEEFKEWAMQAI